MHAAGGEAFLYRLAVVDVLPKPAAKLREHVLNDARLCAAPPLDSTCVERGARAVEEEGWVVAPKYVANYVES